MGKKRELPETVWNYIKNEIESENYSCVTIELNENSDKVDIITEFDVDGKDINQELKDIIEEVSFGKVIILNNNSEVPHIKAVKRHRIMKENDRLTESRRPVVDYNPSQIDLNNRTSSRYVTPPSPKERKND